MRSAGEVMPKVTARLSRGAAHEVLHVLAQRRGTTDERDVRWLDESELVGHGRRNTIGRHEKAMGRAPSRSPIRTAAGVRDLVDLSPCDVGGSVGAQQIADPVAGSCGRDGLAVRVGIGRTRAVSEEQDDDAALFVLCPLRA